jgi:hypothetical protein
MGTVIAKGGELTVPEDSSAVLMAGRSGRRAGGREEE